MHAARCLKAFQDRTTVVELFSCLRACVAQFWASHFKLHQPAYLNICLPKIASIDRLQAPSCLQQHARTRAHHNTSVSQSWLTRSAKGAKLLISTLKVCHIATWCCSSSHAIKWEPICIPYGLQACPVVSEHVHSLSLYAHAPACGKHASRGHSCGAGWSVLLNTVVIGHYCTI